MTKRYRLTSRAQLHGAVREPGYVFTLAEGEIGPHRTVVGSNIGAQIVDHMAQNEDLKDEPLYEEVIETPPEPLDVRIAREQNEMAARHAAEKASLEARHAALKAREAA